MAALPVIAIIDVGKTNKKLFLFDQKYMIVYERSARFIETEDEDGFPCENLESLRLFVFDSLHDIMRRKEFCVKAINFSAYGASLVHIGEDGRPVSPLYNYLKPYPQNLQQQFYDNYGGEENFSFKTASPVLGSLNSGMQLYRIKHDKPDLFKQIKYALHLPQYISYLVTGNVFADITSIGCHTNLWDFTKNNYHDWVYIEGVIGKLPPIISCNHTVPSAFGNFLAGAGLHDSSAALIPYHVNFHEPFVLISTGTWCISLNPFNQSPLTLNELKQDCLCFMHFQGRPIKASRIFAGNEHEDQVKRITDHFHQNPLRYSKMEFNPEIMIRLQTKNNKKPTTGNNEMIKQSTFVLRDLSDFETDEEAYHQLMKDIVAQQFASTQLVMEGGDVKRIFVDGGFGKNEIYMNLLASAFTGKEVFAASMAQATAVGTALAIHNSWNKNPIPNNLIELKYYAVNNEVMY